MKLRITLITLALVFLFSCKAKKEVTEKPSSVQNTETLVVSPVEFQSLSPVEENPETIKLAATYDGSNLYSNNCGNCHTLFNPGDYSKEKWVPIMKRMQKKARINDAETLAIYNYLITETK